MGGAFRWAASWTLYGLGHALSKLPYFGWYRLYNWLMNKSSDLDREGRIWKFVFEERRRP